MAVFVDLGAPAPVDHFGLVAMNAAAGARVQLARCTGPNGAGAVTLLDLPVIHPGSIGPSHNFAARVPPTVSQHWRVTLFQGDGGPRVTLGRVLLGTGFEHATSLGGGRLPVDPAPRQAFADGGFGTGEGTVKRIVRWRYEDLTDDQLDVLEAIAETRGTSRPVMVVEHSTVEPVRARAIHYGLFGTFEAPERTGPDEHKWGLSLEEWR